MTEYERWLKLSKDSSISEELLSINGNDKEIEDRFYKSLAFGTGGLRGLLGAGINRMNYYTVGRATFGVATYLVNNFKNPSIAIAFDSRNMSKEFAEFSAEIFSSMGIKTYLFKSLTPTPVLSYTVRKLKTCGGIVITASHNPKEYNGYKVYNENGCQITDAVASIITECIEKHDYFENFKPNNALIEVLDDDFGKYFLKDIKKFSLSSIDKKCIPEIVYTPLHGTGLRYVKDILSDLGVNNLFVVPEQELPDGNFTTCPYPNPEEKPALKLAIEYAKNRNADLVIATDPDADRVGIAVKDNNGEFRLFNGNETGCVLLYYVLECKKALNKLGKKPTAIKTVVTSDMIFAIAKDYGVNVLEVLTGFKYIGEALDKIDNYVLGLEESYGYLVGDHARDKDAISAVMLIVEACAYFKNKGKSLLDILNYLYEKYGYYKTDLTSVSHPGKDGMAKMKEVLEKVRNNPNLKFNGEQFVFTDFKNGINGLPKSDVLRFLSNKTRVIIRPSGTEPKMKVYYQVIAKNETESNEQLKKLKEEVENNLLK